MVQTPTPRVSAIMIFLNGEAFLAEAIDSVLAQQGVEWELILVDDGSGPAATAIARAYADNHPGKVRYIEHPGHANLGMSASRNAGLAVARGDYAAFLDADDKWLAGRLQAHVELLDSHPQVSVVIGQTLWWRSWQPAGAHRFKPWEGIDTPLRCVLPLGRVIEPPDAARIYLETRGAGMPGICSVTVRVSDALAVGGFNPDFRTLYEDQVFHFRTALRFRMLATAEIHALYRQHPDSACNSEGRRNSDAKMRPIFLEWLQRHLVESGCTDQRIWTAFRAEMFRFDQPTLWWWSRLPRRARDWWNENSQNLLVLLLGPKGYDRLRQRVGKPPIGVSGP
jgi:glycosyltransferase involved in cell wall biosynthesis